MRPPEAILWDWDNTLIDAWAGITSATNTVFSAYGMPEWSVDEAKANIRGSVRDVFPGLFGAAWEDAAALLRQTMAERHLAHLVPMPGAEDMLKAAAALPMAVVSNKDGPLLRPEVLHLGWTGRFRAIVGAGDAAADKPRPDSIWLALELSGLKRGPAVWYVGDNASDMQAARAARCTAVLLGDAAHDVAAFGLHVPHLHFVTAADLVAALSASADAC